MSSISSVGGASSAWPDPGAMRAAMKERMFAKVDTDGSGSVDKSEMQTMVEAIASKSGKSVGSADELMTKMDGNGDGSLSSDELDAGMKSLLPAPSSTVDFAQQHGRTGGSAVDDLFTALDTDGDGTIGKAELSAAVSGPPPGPPAEGAPPAGGAAGGASGASGTSSTTSYDPLDTNEDGVVSVPERMAGEVQDLLKAMDTNGDQSISAGEVDSFISQGAINPNVLGDLVREEYTRAAANYASTTTVDAAA